VGDVELPGPIGGNDGGRVRDTGHSGREVHRVLGHGARRGNQRSVTFGAVVPEHVHAQGRVCIGDAGDDEEHARMDSAPTLANRIGNSRRLYVNHLGGDQPYCGLLSGAGRLGQRATCPERGQQDDEPDYGQCPGDQCSPAVAAPGLARPVGARALTIIVSSWVGHIAHSNLTEVNFGPRLDICQSGSI